MHKLQREFYDRDTIIVAKELLGKYLVHKIGGIERIGKIVEVEAYLGSHDYLWTVNATCNIQGTSKGKILVSILKNNGVVNGRRLSTGQATSVHIKNNQRISVSAEPGTKVNLINLGSDPVQAICST